MFQAQKDSMDCWWKLGLLPLPSSRTRVVRGHSLIDLGFNLKQKDARIIAIIQYWIRKLQSLNIRFIKNRKYIAITRYLDSNSPKAQEQLSCFQDTLNKIIIVFTLIQWTIKTNFVTKNTCEMCFYWRLVFLRPITMAYLFINSVDICSCMEGDQLFCVH